MKQRGKAYKILIITVLILGGGLFFAKYFSTEQNKPTYWGKEYDQYVAEIKMLGAKPAYEKFKQETTKEPSNGQRHFLAHVFGTALYDKEGLTGIGICDDAFAYGCYHSFLGTALSDKGLEILPDLDRACMSQFGSEDTVCQHGIGHGIVGHLGYKKQDLLAALQACKTISVRSATTGCKSGVFMEYNQQTLVDPTGSGQTARPLDPSNPHEPCTWVPEEFQPACYGEQPHWWKIGYDWDLTQIGQLCLEASSQYLAEICVSSLGGSLVSNYDKDIPRIIAACEKMPSKESQLQCLTGAAGGFDEVGEKRNFCEILEQQLQPACLASVTKK